MKAKISKSWIGGVVAALAASLCCIAPLLAVFGGVSGAATTFNWISPYRPYIIGLTALIFGVAWYQQLVIAVRDKKDCCIPAKRSFWQSRSFLLIVTLVSAALIPFPYYSSLFYKAQQKTSADTYLQVNCRYVRFNIKGMGCADCTKHIDGMLAALNGVAASSTSFEKAQTIVRFDPAKINADSIDHKIKEIGYQPAIIKSN